MPIGKATQFGVGTVLDRVGDPHDGWLVAKRLGLHRGGLHEGGRGNDQGRNAADIKSGSVVQTARCTGASIGQPDDSCLNLIQHPLFDIGRDQPARSRLGVALHRDAALPKPFG